MPKRQPRGEPPLAETDGRVRAALRGDAEAFAWLYQRYVGRVYRYLHGQVQDEAEAEDLTSQTFLTALESLPRYRHRGRFASWLFAIAHNKAIDHLRQRRPHVDLDAVSAVSPDPDPSSRLMDAQQEDALHRAIRGLPHAEQELLRLRYVADLSFGEMAEVLGKREAAVKKALYRLLARLQARMENDHG